MLEQTRKFLYPLFYLLIPASIVRSNLAIPGFESLFLFRIVLFLILLIILVQILFNRKNFLKEFPNFSRLAPIAAFFAVWVLLNLASYFWAEDLNRYIRYNVLLSISLLFTLMLGLLVRDKSSFRNVWKLLLASLMLVIFVALLEIFFDIHPPISKLVDASERLRYFSASFFNHPNDFASYISLMLPFLTLIPLIKEYQKYKWVLLVILFLTLFVLLFTGSRLNYIAVLIGLLLTTLIFLKEKVRDWPWYIFVAFMALLILQPKLSLQTSSSIFKFLHIPVNPAAYNAISQGSELEGSLEEFSGGYGSTTVRKNLVVDSLYVMKNDPKFYLIGVGAGQAESYMARFDNTNGVRSLHNWWLEVVFNHGVLIGAGYLMLFLTLLKKIFFAVRPQKDVFLKYIYSSIFISLIMLAFTSLGPSSSVGFAPYWLVIGLAIAAVKLE